MRPPRLRCTLFPFIYPPHLLLLPATFGLYLLLQTYPYFRALYVIPVRRTKGFPTASFRFHLTMDTLAVQLYTSSLPRRVRDFHPLERAHGAQTKGAYEIFRMLPKMNLSKHKALLVILHAIEITDSIAIQIHVPTCIAPVKLFSNHITALTAFFYGNGN